jgi:hypothetical protein
LLCVSQLGLKSAGAFEKRRMLATKQGLIDRTGSTRSTMYRLAAGVVFNPDSGRYEKKGMV